MTLVWLKGMVFVTTLEKSWLCRFGGFIWTTIQISSVYYKIFYFFNRKLSSCFQGGEILCFFLFLFLSQV